MAASLLEENLRLLHESLTDDVAKKNQAIAVVSDLNQICIQEVTEKEIDLTCSSLFDKEYGVLKFLSKAVVNDELQNCKAKVLDFLLEFLEKVGKKILPYGIEIKDVCVSLFSRDRYAKVRNSAMILLSQLLELCSSLRDDLQIDKLISKFFNELTKTSKLTPTVKEKIYILLGVIAKVYPEYMTPYAERLTSIYMGALKTEMNSKTRKPELSIIYGCLEGLNGTLMNFTESAEEGSKNSYEIFKYARNAIDPKIDLARYDMPRAGLRMFDQHASQFNQYLIEDYENMYSKLSNWSRHRNPEISLLGLKAVESFLTEISEMLKEKARSGTQDGGGIFKFFIRQFRDIMNNDKSSAKELSLSIKGYGLLAGPCRIYMTQADVQFMFMEMLSKTEQQFVGQVNDLENKLYNLPSYLESLASIVREMETITESYALSLEYLMVLLVENMPSLHYTKHFLCCRSILWLLLALMPKGTTFKQVLSGFVYQSLIRTCSHLPVIETENEGEVTPEDPLTKKITYKDFIDTWAGLLDAPLIKDFSRADISLETRRQLTDVMYNEIVTSVLKVLDKLDLTSDPDGQQSQDTEASTSSGTSDESGIESADPLLGVQARRPKDFQVFINLVDFCRDLLPTKHYEKFECWVFPFSHKLILFSSENPLASGFYKLLSVCMKIANKVNYFEGLDVNAGLSVVKQESESMEVDISESVGLSQKYSCFLLLKKFSKEVLVRMKQYRDDLLASCLTFVLSLPKEVIIDQMTNVVSAIQVTLTIGLSYLPLAMVAMDALEFWSKSLPGHVMSPYYNDILPCLDSFLKTTDQGAEDVNIDKSVSTNKSKSGRGRQKLSVNLIKAKKAAAARSYQSQLAVMKQRIMVYLGRLGGSINHSLLAGSEDKIAKQAIAWDQEQHLKFHMPFVDMKPTIYLDPFLPRVTELATTSSDRQTKVAACELLHSLVIYSIGCSAQQPGALLERTSMAPLFKNLFPAILKLACDVEQVAKQLFEPLTMQLIHWFTNSKKTESPESMRLLDAIYDGMIQQSNTALRDFSARCLHEFIKWAIKQTSAKMAESNPANAKSVLKRLFSFALHPSASKRLAASLAFNNIYTVFREEEPLVNMFTFQLLVTLVDSLAIAHHDEKSSGTQEQCCKALEHLEKIILHKAEILKNPNENRVEPKNWNSITLDIAVRWLARQCGRPQTECRHACMKLVFQLCTLIGGVKTPVRYFQGCLKKVGAWFWIERFEGGGNMTRGDKGGIDTYPTLTDMSDTFSMQTTLSWFDYVLAALDCYTWVFGESLLSPGELFGGKLKSGKQSNIFRSVEYFLLNVSMTTIEDVARLYGKKYEVDLFTPREIDDFNRAKCTVIVRLFSFLTIMLAKYSKETISVTPKSVFGPELWDLILSCVVNPSSVGFNLGDVEIMKNLPLEMSQMLQVFSKAYKADMTKHFTEAFCGDKNIFAKLPIRLDDNTIDQVSMQQQFSGYLLLQEVDILLPCLPSQSGTKCAMDLMDNVFKGIVTDATGNLSTVTLSPTSLSLANVMLKLALSLGISSDILLEHIFDPTAVCRGSGKTSVQPLGDLFFSTFKSTISWHCVMSSQAMVPALVKHAGEEPSRVCALLTATVDYVTRDRTLRKKEGPKVLNVLMDNWSSLSGWWGKSSTLDQQNMALMLVTKLLLIDSKFASTPGHKSFDHMFSMYQALLTDTKTNLSFKCRVLDLLPFFASVPDPYTAKLRASLDRLVADCFPLRSSELMRGSPKYNDYISTIDKILSGFQLSGSLMLLQFLITIFCREPQHVHENAIQSAIAKFTRRLPRDKQAAALDIPYNIFVKMSFPSEIRRATIERVCLSMLRLVNKSVFIEFFTNHIVQFRELLDLKLAKGEAVLEGQLVTRIGCFQLLEAMYSRLSKDDVVGMTSRINQVFAGGEAKSGKELTSFVSKTAHEAKGEDIRGETTLLELRRQYHCAAYNLMVAFVSRTQSELKFYTAFLFEEKEFKGQFLLENFVDKDRVYEFEVEFESPIERKKKFVALHKEARERRREEDDSYEDETPSLHLATQYLADSSLSEDVSQYFSMTASVESLGSGGGRKRRKQRAGSSPEEEQDVEAMVQDDYVELEMDALNQHECMATFIAVIKHMQENKITPDVAPGTMAPAMPSWMEKLHTKMSNSRTHYNIKLFIAKLVMNTAKIFQPYASHWLQPFIQLIVTGPLGSGNINYFVVDLIIMLLSWHKTAIPKDTVEDKALSSRLVHFVVKNIYHDSRRVFRNNLEMLKTLLECWKGRFEIPYQEVYAQFSSSDMKSRDNTVGIQVLGVVITCKLPPYGPSAPVDRERYFIKVANNMGHLYKTIYAPTAEVCGMIFHYLAEKEDEKDGGFHTHVSKMMSDLHQAKPDTFITCVHRMQKHYPAIADRFINKLLFKLPKLNGEFKTLCLEVLFARIENIENAFLELSSKGIMTCLSHRDEATQLVSLKIVKALLPKVKPSELSQLMPLIGAFGSNPSTGCRNIMYEILMWIYDNYRDEDSDEGNKIIQLTKESLLKGLGDEDLHCRLQVQNFWSSDTRLPVNTLDRLVDMLKAMYSPVTEQQYLSYATNLLLEMTSKSPDYQREIFENPLSECKFSDYSVKSSWRHRHATMTPLFATQSTQSDMIVDDSLDGVRATQDVQQFTQTLEAGAHKGPFNWLTQSSLDTYADASIVPMETQTLHSTLLFSVGTSDSQGGSLRRPKPGPGFGKQKLSKPKPATSGDKKGDTEEASDLNRLKRRFFKDTEQSQMYFAKKQIRINEMREIAQKEQKVRRENQVTMYRKYRDGDLPDIQIKYSYIIAPLQALAQRDSTIAKLLMSGIFQAIFAQMDEMKTEREMIETISQINTSLDNVLSQSTKYYPPFIGCVLDILYNLRTQLKVNVANVGSSAIFSKLQPLGITVLEEQLIQHEPVETRAPKRRRVEVPISMDVNHWMELARLYKSVDEYDILMGIFSGKIGTQSITKKAVEAEARGDYHSAKKLYDEALISADSTEDEGPNQAEMDLWEEGRMECLQYLSQWDSLQKVSCDAVESPNLTGLWEDTFLQNFVRSHMKCNWVCSKQFLQTLARNLYKELDHRSSQALAISKENFLPYILRSKVKLMLHGDTHQQSLLDFVDISMRVPEQKLFLENGYSEELALMYLWQEDYDRARHYCNNALEAFLQEWSSMDTLMMNSRTRAIQKLQPLIEMQEFLKFMSNENNFQSIGPSQSLVNSWNQRMPHLLTDPVTIWDDLVTNRTVYLDRISSKLQKHDDSQNSSMSEEIDDMFLDTKLQLKLRMANSSKEQNNFSLTLKILRETKSDCKNAEGSLLCKWTHLYASTHHKKVHSSLEAWSDESLHNIYMTIDQLGKVSENEALVMNPNLGRQHYILAGQGLELLVVGIKDIQNMKDIEDSKVGGKLMEYTGLKKMNKIELTEKLVSEGYKKMKASLSVEDVVTKETSGITQDEAYLATAKYCDNILRMKEDDDDDENKLQVGKKCIELFPETLVICLLKAMKLNSEEALQRFPRLLQIVELYPNTMATFISKSSEVPCWMYILWISQMLAILDKPEAKAVYKILEEITDLYPQAVIYPMKLSREGYTFGKNKDDKINQDIVDRLCSKLSPERLPLAHRFIAALECFEQPDQAFKDSFDEMVRLMQKKKKKEVVDIYKELYDRVLDYKNREKLEAKSSKSSKSQSKGAGDQGSTGDDDESSQIGSDSMLDIGSYAKKFADKFKDEFDKRFGTGGKNLDGMSMKNLDTHRRHLMELLGNAAKGPLRPPGKLSEYSKWMADFKPNVNRMTLELPGQYTGLTKPLPEYHVKIAGFDERISVMTSIRKPKKLMIRGNDEKDYPFLVKGGEDLRQDQRIEQLFFIMNQVFSKDSACRNRKLKLKMYQVIPMTPRVGLIEWVSDTIPLKNFIMDSLTEQEKKSYTGKQGPNAVHNAWIMKVCKEKESWPQRFYNIFNKYSKTQTMRQLAETESKVPWDLFRRSFQHLSTSPEAFHVLRCHSMQSHAMLCICQYILGIGDRHQSNFMVNLKTGEMVGIDFGHAFGSATQFLPVPELVPFRLTRQFCNLMLPLQVQGLLESTMIHVLRALRSDSDLLLNTMDVFVKEPSLDWKQNAERQVQSMPDEDVELYSQEEKLLQWYPKQKIDFVKRKLKGANPAHITRDELKLGHGKKEAYKDFKTVALGLINENDRADLPPCGLTVEQQVTALIDQATDPNILGRTWIGWEPWV